MATCARPLCRIDAVMEFYESSQNEPSHEKTCLWGFQTGFYTNPAAQP